MFIMGDEMWNSVTIYGSRSEIARFKAMFVRPSTAAEDDEESDLHLDLAEVGGHDTWNFRELGRDGPWSYAFAFDTAARFPEQAFEQLAELFPTVRFACECIADNDTSMGYGWFNTPTGGKNFNDSYSVPRNYWTSRGVKRSPKAQQRHEAVIAAVEQALREAEDGKS